MSGSWGVNYRVRMGKTPFPLTVEEEARARLAKKIVCDNTVTDKKHNSYRCPLTAELVRGIDYEAGLCCGLCGWLSPDRVRYL